MDYIKMAEDEQNIPFYIKKWQDILNLNDWDIRHEVVDKLSEDNLVAEVVYNTWSKKALVRYISAPQLKYNLGEFPQMFMPTGPDYEVRTVHELLHICFSEFNDVIFSMLPAWREETQNVLKTTAERLEEQMVNKFARLLVQMDEGRCNGG